MFRYTINKSIYRVTYILIVPILATVMLAYLHDLGYEWALSHGRSLRGGIGYGFSLIVSIFIFYITFLLKSALITKPQNNYFAITSIIYLIFFLYSYHMFGGYFSKGWSHPLRAMYFHFCGTIIFFAPAIIIKLFYKIRRCITKT